MAVTVSVDAFVDPRVVLRAGNAAHATQNTERLHGAVIRFARGLLSGTLGDVTVGQGLRDQWLQSLRGWTQE